MMIVRNLTDSIITLSTGEVLRPRQVRAMSVNVLRHFQNQRFVDMLVAKGKLYIEAVEGEGNLNETPGRTDLHAPRKGSAPVSPKHQREPIPENLSREFVAYAPRDVLAEIAGVHGIDGLVVRKLNDEELRLYVGSIIFNDPGLYRD